MLLVELDGVHKTWMIVDKYVHIVKVRKLKYYRAVLIYSFIKYTSDLQSGCFAH